MPRFHADNHNGMQVRYLVGARAAVGKWVSMRHYVMAFGTKEGDRLGASRSVHNREGKVISKELISCMVSSLSRHVHVRS